MTNGFDLIPMIETLTEKISNHFPEWITPDGINYARNKTLAKIFVDFTTELRQMKNDMTVKSSSNDIPFMIGVFNQPKTITGIRFFHIAPEILINEDLTVKEFNRIHTLNFEVDSSGNKFLGIDNVNLTLVEDTGMVVIDDIDANKLHMLVNFDKLPNYNVDEQVEFIPVYSEDYLTIFTQLYGFIKLFEEDPENYRERVLHYIRTGSVSAPALNEILNKYAEFYDTIESIELVEHREHYKSYFQIGRSFITKIEETSTGEKLRKYMKYYSNNVNYLVIDIYTRGVGDEATVENELNYLMNKLTMQGTWWDINYKFII